ncbi:MAG TPA: type II secretion system F family protein [Alphaproteobacteria bacterium]|nr:type II secretion system F family protein [Alphaproteobacteria bacterium]
MISDSLIFGLPALPVLLVFLALMAVPATFAYFVAEQFGPRARLRARLAIIANTGPRRDGGQPLQRRTRQVEARLKEAGHAGGQGRRRMELRHRIEQAGLTLTVRNFYLLSAIAGIISAAVYVLLGYSPLFAVAVLASTGLGLPRLVLRRMAKRRQKAFTRLFADAVDVIVRGIRSGLPVGECLAIIARESPDPVGAEFKLMVEGQKLGMTLKQALERACRRMPTADMKFFAVVLTLQQQTGGNLAETLAGLSNLLRGRKKMAAKIRAMSSEARMTAGIIGCLPFLISLVIYLLNPGYISLLWTNPIGEVMLYGGLLWMGIGVFIMKQLVSFEI